MSTDDWVMIEEDSELGCREQKVTGHNPIAQMTRPQPALAGPIEVIKAVRRRIAHPEARGAVVLPPRWQKVGNRRNAEGSPRLFSPTREREAEGKQQVYQG